MRRHNPLAGITVTFAVTGGGGSLDLETTRTNQNGRAWSLLTLGNRPGTNTVTVSVVGIAETVTFTAIGERLEFNLSLTAGINLIHVPSESDRSVDGTPGSNPIGWRPPRRTRRCRNRQLPYHLRHPSATSGAAISVPPTEALPLIDR